MGRRAALLRYKSSELIPGPDCVDDGAHGGALWARVTGINVMTYSSMSKWTTLTPLNQLYLPLCSAALNQSISHATGTYLLTVCLSVCPRADLVRVLLVVDWCRRLFVVECLEFHHERLA